MSVVEDEKKEYPGGLARWNSLRQREQVLLEQASQVDDGFDSEFSKIAASVSIAAELAGLAYILDGIRYSTRKP